MMRRWLLLAVVQIQGIQLDTAYYMQAFERRGYVKQSKNEFVIANGLRTQFQFEPVPDRPNQVFIRVLSRNEYVTAYSDGHIGSQKHQESWERFTVNKTDSGKYTFQSAHHNYLKADFKTGLLSAASMPGTWEEFSLEPVGQILKTFDHRGRPNFALASKGHLENEYLRRQQENLEFIDHGPSLKAGHSPNIYLIILDTMREDFVNAKTGRNLLAFKNENIHTPISLAGATTTHPSVYSLLNSRPAYEFYALVKSGYSMGPMPLNILKYKLGYTLKATGKKDMGCLDFRPPAEYYPISEKTYLVGREFRFGLQSYLLDDCVQTGLLGNETLYRNGLEKLDENIFKHLLELIESSAREKTVFVAHFEGAHAPYQYAKEDEWVQAGFNWESEKRYASAFHKTDRLFGQFIQELKNKKLYDDALIIVVGDHGEILRAPPHKTGDHGSYPVDNAQARVPMYFKFPKQDNQRYQHITRVSTLSDVFPTVFEYLGVWKETQQFFTGRPISDLRTHVVPVMRVNPDNAIAFYVYPFKIKVKYRPWLYTRSESMDQLQNVLPKDFELVGFESFDDVPLRKPDLAELAWDRLANFEYLLPMLFQTHARK